MLLEWGGEDCAHTLQIIKNHYKKNQHIGQVWAKSTPLHPLHCRVEVRKSNSFMVGFDQF